MQLQSECNWLLPSFVRVPPEGQYCHPLYTISPSQKDLVRTMPGCGGVALFGVVGGRAGGERGGVLPLTAGVGGGGGGAAPAGGSAARDGPPGMPGCGPGAGAPGPGACKAASDRDLRCCCTKDPFICAYIVCSELSICSCCNWVSADRAMQTEQSTW